MIRTLLLLSLTLLTGACVGCNSQPPIPDDLFKARLSPGRRLVHDERIKQIEEMVANGFTFERKRFAWMPGRSLHVPNQPCPSCLEKDHGSCSTKYVWMPNRFHCTCRHRGWGY